MEVTKVKFIGEEVTVLRTKPNGRHDEGLSLEKCPDPPEESFKDALARVEACLVERAKGKVTFKKAPADAGKASEQFTLTGISMSRSVNGRRQFTASCKIDLGWGEKGASLALLLEPDEERDGESGIGNGNVLTDEELEAIESLFAEGNRYAEGHRETQREMPLGEGEDEAAPDGTDPFDPESEEAGEPALAGAGAPN